MLWDRNRKPEQVGARLVVVKSELRSVRSICFRPFINLYLALLYLISFLWEVDTVKQHSVWSQLIVMFEVNFSYKTNVCATNRIQKLLQRPFDSVHEPCLRSEIPFSIFNRIVVSFSDQLHQPIGILQQSLEFPVLPVHLRECTPTNLGVSRSRSASPSRESVGWVHYCTLGGRLFGFLASVRRVSKLVQTVLFLVRLVY